MPQGKKKASLASRWAKEFKDFASRGNIVDMAVGVIVGGAFGKMTNSLVNDIFMPVCGMLLGGVKFDSLEIVLSPSPFSDESVTLKLGSFISTIVDFFLIALSVFIMVKLINTLRHVMEEPKPSTDPEPPPDVALLTEIRDLLKDEEDQDERDVRI